MRCAGRVVSAGLIPTVINVYVLITHAAGGTDYGTPIEIKVWDTGRKPLAHMVDVTNEFGLKVLAEHNFLNNNNIAFSPYGLMGILVALYEGVDGESSYQIQRGMQLPWNRNVMRIGFRDIHRTLKTYFVPEEGFLAGLALNNENVTFNDSYKKILRFYGFDMDNDQIPPQNNGTLADDTIVTPSKVDTSTGNQLTTIAMSTKSTPAIGAVSTPVAKEDTTSNSNSESVTPSVNNDNTVTTPNPTTASKVEETTAMATTTLTAETMSTTEQTTITSAITTLLPTTNSVELLSTSAPETTTKSLMSNAETSMPTTAPATVSTVNVQSTVNKDVEILTTPSSTVMSTETSTGAPSTVMSTETSTGAPSTIMSTETSTGAPSTVLSTETSTDAPSTDASTLTATVASGETTFTTVTLMDQMNEASGTLPPINREQTTVLSTTAMSPITTVAIVSNIETLQRRKKSIVDFIFTNPPYVDKYLIREPYGINPEAVTFDSDKMFLANGLRNIHATYMHYDTVLEYAYLPHLEASALRLPLDSERYYLLVVLPLRAGEAELGRLLARMARESDLRDVYAALRPRRIRAMVPSFTVKGHITLTTDLQKLGIRDVFEPRQHDFTPMTPQPGVYVRSIEQAVSVSIRKYQPDDHKKNRYVSTRQPIQFSATYPFLYFVMDASIHVALMAGKMVDPLNTRIL